LNIRARIGGNAAKECLMPSLIHRVIVFSATLLSLTPFAGLPAQGVADATAYQTVSLPPGALSAAPVPADTSPIDATDAKLHAQLRAALGASARGVAWSTASGLPQALRRGDEVLVEVRFGATQNQDDALNVLARHGAIWRDSLGASLHEAWIPLDRLRELAGDASVLGITPARLARHTIGSKTSEGVAAGNVNYWQTFNPSYTGTGVTIAMVDSYDNTKIASLQSTGDWPKGTQISCYNVENITSNPPYTASPCTGSTFGSQAEPHGNATMEIVYDVAPGAKYRAYDTVTVGDWYNSILDAANVNSSGASLGAVKANVISASLAAPLDGIGDGTSQTGSIAQAAGFARTRGVLVVNAAGNERENHWGGSYQSSSLAGDGFFHSWNGTTNIYNPFVNSTNMAVCIPDNNEINVEFYWNNWLTPVTHTYQVGLYELGSTNTTWTLVASSDCTTYGNGTCTTPQALIQYETAQGSSTKCNAGSAVYAVAVLRETTTTYEDNLQVFASVAGASIPLQYSVAARSLDFPADSPNVLSVAAIDVANTTTTPSEPFSSEGPVLATGGGLPVNPNPLTDTNLKPDVSSFDNVTTVTYGAGGKDPPPSTSFLGTSAATPHVAGMAALFMQRSGIQTTAATLTSNIVTPLRTIASTGSNDLGTAGNDYIYGYGRLRFQKDAALAYTQQPTSALVNTAITPAIMIGIYDTEGNLDSYTLFNALTLAIANDPNGGSAVLSGGGSANFSAGKAQYSAAKINLSGTGYTLKASASATSTPPISLSVISNAFNITTGAAAKLAFTVQPSTVQAGKPITPAVTVSIQDSNNNVVTSDNTTQIKLVRTTCSQIVPVGGALRKVTNGVATFPGLTLHTSGSNVQLQALGTDTFSATSSAFTVSANPDFIFRNGFESCIP
jgi:subtilisin family serine protease